MIEALLSRSRLILLAMAAILLGGVLCYQALPRREDPELSFGGCTVAVPYPGALPREVEDAVTVPLEKRLLSLRGLRDVTSYSSYGRSVTVLEFHEKADHDRLTQEVREALEAVRADFPEDVETPDLTRWQSETVAFLLAVSGPYGWGQLEHYARTLARQVESVHGVERAELDGIPARQLLVELEPAQLLSHGLTVPDVVEALSVGHVALPGGTIGLGRRDLLVSIPWRFNAPEDVGNTAIPLPDGGVVTVADLGSVRLAYGDDQEEVRLNSEPAVGINVWLAPDASPTATGKRLDEVLAASELPENMSVEYIHDQGRSVARRVGVFQGNLVLGALLVVLLTGVIMGVRMATIVSVAVPVSIAVAFLLMTAGGMSLNQVTLASLVLVLGMLVDNAIVVVENVQRHLNMRRGSLKAVTQGTREVVGPIGSSTLTTWIAFVPLLLMSGHTGQFIRGIPLTVMFAIGGSLLVAVAISPVLSRRILRPGRTALGKQSRLATGYGTLLGPALRSPGRVIAAAVSAMLLAGVAIPRLGLQFFPKAERDLFVVDLESPPGTSRSATRGLVGQVEETLSHTAGIRSFMSFVGWNGPRIYYNLNFLRSRSPWRAQILVKTSSAKDTPRIVATAADALGDITGGQLEISELEQGPPVGAPVSLVVKGDRLDDLDAVATQIEGILQATEGAVDVRRSSTATLPELRLTLDRGRAGTLGVTGVAAGLAVRAALSGAHVGDVRRDDGDVELIVRLPQSVSDTPDLLNHLHVRSTAGALVPLERVVDARLVGGTDEIVRENGVRTVTVRANVRGRLPGQVMSDAKKKIEPLRLPSGVVLEVGGETAERDESFASLGRVMAVAVLLIYAVLVGQFDSFRQPFAVLLAVPLSLVGGVVGLALTGYPFGFMAFLGVVSLTGVVVNDAIVLVSYFNLLRRRGTALADAVTEGCMIRMRPVLLTTITTIGGLLPLAFRGGSLWGPMAWVIIFGLGGATLLTLVVVPCVYLLLERGGAAGAGRMRHLE